MLRPLWALVLGTTVLSGLPGCRSCSRSSDDGCGPGANEPPHRESITPFRDAGIPFPVIVPQPQIDPLLWPLASGDKKATSILQPPLPDGPILDPKEMPGAGPVPPIQPIVAEKPALKPEPLVEALRCVLENRPDEALVHLKGYDPSTQELFIRLLPPMALLSHKTIDKLSPAEIASLHEQLQSLVVALRPRTELTIGKMCFCEWIKSYGVYKPVADNHVFQAGLPGQPGELVQLYVELQNFCSECRPPFHETRFSSYVEITDANGKWWWRHRFDDRKQPLRSLSELHDFFNNYSFHVPHIPPGAYTLTIQVADETLPDQRRVTKKSLPMTVRAP
jgi:hypothetical protein